MLTIEVIQSASTAEKTFGVKELTHARLSLDENKLHFFRDTEYRRLELLELVMMMSDEEEVKALTNFRINSTIQQALMVEERIKDILELVGQANPFLLEEITQGADPTLQQSRYVYGDESQ